MSADKLLMLTQRGLDLELSLPLEGGSFPPMAHLIICMGEVLDEPSVLSMTSWPDAWDNKIPLGGVKRYPAQNGAGITGHIEAGVSLPDGKVITGIGVELSDGSMYAYAPYYQSVGGLPKPLGVALTLEVMLVKSQAQSLTVRYEPYDSAALAEAALVLINEQLPSAADLAADVMALMPSTVPDPLPDVGTELTKNKTYFLPAGGEATMPPDPANSDYIEFIPVGNLTLNPAEVTFYHPVQLGDGNSLMAGVHQYNANEHRKFVFFNGVWL